MKKACILLGIIIISLPLFSQYYLRGEIKDEKGNPIFGAKIYLQTKGALDFSSGDDGAFGLPTPKAIDTLTVIMQGFEPFKGGVSTQQYQKIVLKMYKGTSEDMLNRLNSFTKNLGIAKDLVTKTETGDSYNNLIENDFVSANTNPETGFALSIDRASYSNVRRFIVNKWKCPKEAVRIEQMLNYFSLKPSTINKTYLQNANNNAEFQFNSEVTNCPWEEKNKLLFINLQAPKLNLDTLPPSNLVFLIDVSGSMDEPNRLPLLQTAFKMLVANIRDTDRISIVTYGGGVRVALYPTSGAEKKKINEVIDELSANGDTPGSGAIKMAYTIAKSVFKKEGNNRVIIATDGDFNVGQNNEDELEEMIAKQKQFGISLTCLGVGMGNFRDSRLEILAKMGNGNYAYLDNVGEAEKVLVTEFTKTLYNVAEDAYLNITFNPDLVNKYRLIGFDNMRDAIKDSSKKIEGGQVGSGHSLMAIFEIEPANKNASILSNYATLNLQYKRPRNKELVQNSFIIPNNQIDLMKADSVYRFATSVTMFASLLRQSDYAKNYNFDTVLQLAQTAANTSNFSQKEFLTLIDKADVIYNPLKKRKKEK